MKVSQELKDEFDALNKEARSLYAGLDFVLEHWDSYPKLHDFLFGDVTDKEDNKNQLQFAKWWAGEEEIEVEEELYYLELPFDYCQYVNLDRDGDVFPGNKKDSLDCRTKFTLDEIEGNEKLRQFEKFKKRVDEDD